MFVLHLRYFIRFQCKQNTDPLLQHRFLLKNTLRYVRFEVSLNLATLQDRSVLKNLWKFYGSLPHLKVLHLEILWKYHNFYSPWEEHFLEIKPVQLHGTFSGWLPRTVHNFQYYTNTDGSLFPETREIKLLTDFSRQKAPDQFPSPLFPIDPTAICTICGSSNSLESLEIRGTLIYYSLQKTRHKFTPPLKRHLRRKRGCHFCQFHLSSYRK